MKSNALEYLGKQFMFYFPGFGECVLFLSSGFLYDCC